MKKSMYIIKKKYVYNINTYILRHILALKVWNISGYNFSTIECIL